MAYLDQCDQSQIEYRGNGSQVLYTFPFTYMKSTDVYVDLYNETTRRWETAASTDWSFANATTIEFTVAPPTPTGTEVFNIRIARCTDIDPLIAQFNPGSAIRAVDLNENFEQLQLAIEEGRCQIPVWLYDYLTAEYWNKFEETTYDTDVWADETDDEHIPTTGAVNTQLTELRTYVDTQDTADRAYTDAEIAKERATTEAEIAAERAHTDAEVARLDAVDATKVDKSSLVTEAQQTSGTAPLTDTNVFSTSAAAARFDTYSQEVLPAAVTYEQPAKEWFDTSTLYNYTWDSLAECWVLMQNAGPPGPAGPVAVGTFLAPLVDADDTVSIDLLTLSKIL